MAAELTIQQIDGLTQSLDKMSRAVGGIKLSLGSSKAEGTNTLKELQKVVSGINQLQTALARMDDNMSNIMVRVIGAINELPTSIANALQTGTSKIRAAGSRTGEAVGDGMAEGLKKSKGAVAAARAALQKEYEAASTAGPLNLSAVKTFRTQGASLFPEDRQRLANLLREERELNQALKRMDLTAREAKAQAENAYNASLSAGARNVQAITAAVAAEKGARKSEMEALQAYLGQKEAAWRKEQDLQAGYAATSLDNGKKLVRAIRANTASEVAARKDALNALEAQYKADARMRAEEARLAKIDPVQVARREVSRATSNSAGAYSPYNANKALTKSFEPVADPKPAENLSKALKRIPKEAQDASSGLQRLGMDANTTHSAMRGLASGFGLLWLTWGNLAPLLTGAALSNGFVQTIKLGTEVSSTFSAIGALSEESSESVLKLENQMLSLGRNGPFGLNEISTAMKTLSLAGLNAAEVGSSIQDVLKFAVAGDTSIQLAADTLVNVATAFKYSATEYQTVADVIAKAAAISKSSVENMSEAFKTASVLHKQFGASLVDVGLGLATLSNLGITGSAAGTALRNMYSDLSGRSKQASALMKQLKIEIRDVDTGKFPDLITMMIRFEEGLDRSGSKLERVSNTMKLTTERGAKPIIEALDQLRTKTDGTSGAVISKLEEMREKLSNASGFVAVANAKMATSASNQIKSVFASLQVAAYEAFKEVEPYIIGISQQMKDVFGSSEFKTALKNSIVLIANFTSFLVTHLDVIAKVGAAYVALKTAMFLGGVAKAAQSSIEGVSRSMLAFQALSAAGGIQGPALALRSTAVNAAAASTAVVGTVSKFSGVLGILGKVAGLLAGPVGIALTAAYTGWELYSWWSKKAVEANDQFSGAAHKAVMNALDEELEAIKERNQATQEGITLEELRLRNKSAKAEGNLQSEFAKREADALEAVARAQKGLDNARKAAKEAGQPAAEATQSLPRLRANLKTAQDNLVVVQQLNLAQKQDLALKAAQVRAGRQLEDMAVAEKRAAREASEEEERRLAMAQANTEAGKEKKVTVATNAVQEAEARFRAQDAAAKAAGDREQRMLQDRLSNKLITEGEFLARSLQQTENTEKARLKIYSEAGGEVSTALAAAEAAAKRNLTGDKLDAALARLGELRKTFEEALKSGQDGIKDDALERVAKASNKAAGELKALETSSAEFWAGLANRQNSRSVIDDLADGYADASDAQKAFIEGASGEFKQYEGRIAALKLKLDGAKDSLEAMKRVSGVSSEGAVGLPGTNLGTPEQAAQIANFNKLVNATAAELLDVEKSAKKAAEAAGGLAIVDKFLNKDFGDNLAKGFDRAGASLAGFVNQFSKLLELYEDRATAEKEALKLADSVNPEDRIKGEDALLKLKTKTGKSEIAMYGNIAAASKSFFKEGSTGYKNLHKAEQAFRLYEFAMANKSVALKVWEWGVKTATELAGHAKSLASLTATEMAANIAKIPGVMMSYMSQLGPWGMAAGAAAIAAVLGRSVKGGAFAPTNEGKGTVLGDSAAKSESVNKALERLRDNSSIELKYSAAMLAALNNIEANISGLAALVVRSPDGLTSGANFGVQAGTKMPALANMLGLGIGSALNKIPVIGKLASALFGTKTSIQGTGLMMDDQRLSSIVNSGADLKNYIDVNQKKSFLGIRYSNKNSTQTSAADSALTDQFTKIFKGFNDAILMAAKPLGQNFDEVKGRLDNFVVSIGKIDLQGLTGTQVQEKLAAVFGAAADSMAMAAMPGFTEFQKVGEGYFETLVRVANGVETARYALDQLGVTMVDFTKLTNKQGDVALEVIRDSLLNTEVLSRTVTKSMVPSNAPAVNQGWQKYQRDEDFVGPIQPAMKEIETVTRTFTGVGKILETFNGSAEELISLYSALMDVREGLKALGRAGLDVSLSMIQGAGGIDKLQAGLTDYYDNYLTGQEKADDMTRRLSKEFDKLGITMPTTVEGFKKLIAEQPLLTEAQQATYGKLITLSGGFWDLQEALKELNKTTEATKDIEAEKKTLQEQLKSAQQAYNEATMTEAQLLQLRRADIDLSNQALFDEIEVIKAKTAAIVKAAGEEKTLRDELNSLTLTETQQLQLKRDALSESNKALFDEVQAAKVKNAIAAEAKTLQDELNSLTLTETQLIAMKREALREENRAVFDQVEAAKLKNAIDAEAKTLQDELNSLTLTETELLNLQRNALYGVNQALFDQIQAAKTAKEELARLDRAKEQGYGLETQLLQLQGDTAKLRERELAKLEPENRELQKKIWAMEDAIEADKKAQAAADAAAQAAQAAAEAATRLKEAWQDAGNGIADEIKRIKGVLGSPSQTLASAQTDFALAIARANAGDIEAAKSLPNLSQNLLKIAEDNASSGQELARIQAMTMSSLERTLRHIAASQGLSVPAFAEGGMHMGGLRVVGEDGPELEATGAARVWTAKQTAEMMNGGPSYAELAAQVAELTRLVGVLIQEQAKYGTAIATSTQITAKILRDITPDRDAIATREAT